MLNTISNLLYLTFCYHSIYDDSYDYDDWREWLLIGIGVLKYRYRSIPKAQYRLRYDTDPIISGSLISAATQTIF